jgi:hypothetical protein
VLGVVGCLRALARRCKRCARQRREIVSALGLHVAERVDEVRAALSDLAAFVAVVLVDRDEDLAKRRHAVPALLRKIGPREDRNLLRRQEHRQRPAAGLSRHQLMARLIDLVEIRALLAVDFDVDVQIVHEPCCRIVLERLVGHDVAPMARRVPDG